MNKTLTFEWLPELEMGFLLDPISGLFSGLVIFITVLVIVFSLEYMKESPRIRQYYAYLIFFAFSMVLLIMSDHLIMLFIFWELVGFSSYLLIGFWYDKSDVPNAQLIAFMVNRLADVALFAGILLQAREGSLSMSSINAIGILPSILMVIGAFGKSAQLPFSGWLTKAMVGPTPVSALIHAATMVAAGVYLLFRLAPVLDQVILTIVAITGSLTALYGGLCALNQYDIKKVLAYSTISQLGYMMIGIGVGAREAGLFHLWTHAFFKAGLFLSAGAIMHYMHAMKPEVDSQDMRNMGGLRKHQPVLFVVFLVFLAALAGLPLFSGYLSKEAILLNAVAFASRSFSLSLIVPVLALATVLLTSFYCMRMCLLIFMGHRATGLSPKRTQPAFALPLVLLALCSGWIIHSIHPLGHTWNLYESLGIYATAQSVFWVTPVVLALVVVGVLFAYRSYAPSARAFEHYPNTIPSKVIFEGFYLNRTYRSIGDWVYRLATLLRKLDDLILDKLINILGVFTIVFSKGIALLDRFIVDGLVNLMAKFFSLAGFLSAGISARKIQLQLTYLLIGLILILAWFFLTVSS